MLRPHQDDPWSMGWRFDKALRLVAQVQLLLPLTSTSHITVGDPKKFP